MATTLKLCFNLVQRYTGKEHIVWVKFEFLIFFQIQYIQSKYLDLVIVNTNSLAPQSGSRVSGTFLLKPGQLHLTLTGMVEFNVLIIGVNISSIVGVFQRENNKQTSTNTVRADGWTVVMCLQMCGACVTNVKACLSLSS